MRVTRGIHGLLRKAVAASAAVALLMIIGCGGDVAKDDLGLTYDSLMADSGTDIVGDHGTDPGDVSCGTCSGGKICVEGECECPSTQEDCDGTCKHLGTNEDCSGCGDACVGVKSCQDGECVAEVDPDCVSTILCVTDADCEIGSRCNQAMDYPTCQKLYCGGYGTACSEDYFCLSMHCMNGACADCESVGQADCSGTCTVLGTRTNCSGCGDECRADQRCNDGVCGEPPSEILIPAGSFWMGCNAAVDSWCEGDEKPYHEVTLSRYYMDRTEVTQSAYKTCVDAGKCGTPRCYWDPTGTPDRPVVCVDWTEAGEYCTWAGKRLPTEAEWEKAARGTDGRKYPWGNETATCDCVVMSGCPGDAMDVCSKSPVGDSPYGLCDMAGNAQEWVSDWHGSDYYDSSPTLNPTGPASGSYRVVRGGCYSFGDGGYLRASRRTLYDPPYYEHSIGFRCARDAL